ncbi:MAG: ECF transporter S component [Enterocloster sp.]
MKSRKKMTVNQMVLIALAACINTAGGQAALALRLPVYLDSIGTILAGILLGPIYGMLPNLLSGILMGMTTDIYSLYFAPVGMVTGFMAGLASRECRSLWDASGAAAFSGCGADHCSRDHCELPICAGLFAGSRRRALRSCTAFVPHPPGNDCQHISGAGHYGSGRPDGEPFSGVCSRRRCAGPAETGHMRPAGQSLRSLRKENSHGNTRGTVQQDHC